MLELWEPLAEKLDFIIKVMQVDIRDLAANGAVLYYDLDHIKVSLFYHHFILIMYLLCEKWVRILTACGSRFHHDSVKSDL
jgi:hypothetical protein